MSATGKLYDRNAGVRRVILTTGPQLHPFSNAQDAPNNYYCLANDMKGFQIEVDLQAMPPGVTIDQIAPNQVWWVEKRTTLYRLYLYGGVFDQTTKQIDSTQPIPNGGGGGITQLTGDVTASGTGTVVATLSATGAAAGTYGSSTQVPQFTVDAKGRISSVTNVSIPGAGGVTSVTAGDSTVTIGGTTTNPTVAVTPNTFDAYGAASTVQSNLNTLSGQVATISGVAAAAMPTVNVTTYGAKPLTTYQASSSLNNWNFNFGSTASGDSSTAFYNAYQAAKRQQATAGTPATIYIPAGDYVVDPSVAKWWTFTNDLLIQCEDLGLTRIWLYDSNNTFGTWQNSVSIAATGTSTVTATGSNSLVTINVVNSGSPSINTASGNTAFIPSVILGDYLTVSGASNASYNGSWQAISTSAGAGTIQLLISGTVSTASMSGATVSIVRPVNSFIFVELLDTSYLYGRTVNRPYLDAAPPAPSLRPGILEGLYCPPGMIGIDYGPGVYGRIQAQFQNFDVRTQGKYSVGTSPSIGLRIGARDNYWCEDTVIEDGTLSRNCQVGLYFHNYNGQGSFQGTMIKKFYAATNQPEQVGVKLGYGKGIPVTAVQYLASGSGGNPTGQNCLKWTLGSGYNVGAAGTLQISVANMPYPEYNGNFNALSYSTGLNTVFYTTLGNATSVSPTLSGTLGEIQNSSTFYQSYFNAETVQQYQTPFFGNLTQVYQLGASNNVTGLVQPATNSLYVYPSGGMPSTPAVSGSKFYFSALTAPASLSGNLGREFTVTNNVGGYYTVTGTTSSTGGVGFTSVTGTLVWGDYASAPGLVYGSGIPAYVNANSKYNSAFTVSTPAPASGTATITSGNAGGHATLTWSGTSNSFYYWQLGCGVYTDSLGLIGYLDPNTNSPGTWSPNTGTISSGSVALLRNVSTNTTDAFYVTNFPDKIVSPSTIVTITGATYGSGATTITGINTTSLVSGMYLFGTGIRVPTTISSVASGSITINRATGSSASNTTLWVDSYVVPDESPYVARDFPTITFSGTTTVGSNAIPVSSVSGLAVGQSITSVQGGLLNGTPAGYLSTATTITAISGGTSTIYISNSPVKNGTNIQLFVGYGKTGASHAGTIRNNPTGLNLFAAGTSKTINVDPFYTNYSTAIPTAGATSPAQLFGASIGLQLGSSFTDSTNFTGSRFELTGEDHQTETIGYYLNENFKFDGTGIIDYEYGTPLVQVSQSQAGTVQFLGDVNVRETAFDRSHVFNQTNMFNVSNAFGTQYSVGTTPAVNPRARIVGDIQQLGTYYTNYFSVQNLQDSVQNTAQILATQSTLSGIDLLQIKDQSNTNAGHNLFRTWLNGSNALTTSSGAHYTAQTQGFTVFQIDARGNTVAAGNVTSSGITVSGSATISGSLTVSGSVTASNIQDSGWINVTSFSGTFTSGGVTPAYRLLNSVVYMRGNLASGTANTTAFQLPSGYRPSVTTVLSTPFTYAVINTDGTVVPAAATVTSLNGIIFPIG